MKALIVGAGKLGYRLADALVDEGVEIVVVDKNDEVIENISNLIDVMTVKANALDFMVLKELDISSFDMILATTKNDEANVVLCSISKKLGCKFAVARVRDPEYLRHLSFMAKELDIDYIINPDFETAEVIEKYLLKKYLLMSDEFVGGKVKLVEFNVANDENFVGQKLMDLKGFDDLLVTAISRSGETIIPNGQSVLMKNDIILVGGDAHAIEQFDRDHSGVERTKSIEKVMIVGGGKVGFYLALLLNNANVEVTIIEKDMERCLFLKETLPDCTVIQGDGTNMNLLEEEMIHTFDGFVATTGIDEANLLNALVVKQMGVYKTVAKISRSNYNMILDRLVIDGVFNSNFITASKILRLIRGSGALSVNLMLGGDAEFTEMIINKGTLSTDKKIKDLDLPEGILIVALVRENEVIIPNGDSILQEGDHAVLFCTRDRLSDMKRIFQKDELANEALWKFWARKR
ncbi:MAG: Trk system potassium transporter TrkA [Tissierellia bacterium]|nr:Trk system potassium transporter TrkA [Tissierellia bacterium]